jgi:hypothetical protein
MLIPWLVLGAGLVLRRNDKPGSKSISRQSEPSHRGRVTRSPVIDGKQRYTFEIDWDGNEVAMPIYGGGSQLKSKFANVPSAEPFGPNDRIVSAGTANCNARLATMPLYIRSSDSADVHCRMAASSSSDAVPRPMRSRPKGCRQVGSGWQQSRFEADRHQ